MGCAIKSARQGFTLLELIVVVAMVCLLTALVVPALARAMTWGRRGACVNSLRQMQTAYLLYLGDHDGKFFPYVENTSQGRLYYFGLDSGGGAEGDRPLDLSYAKLAPYIGGGSVEICPAMPYRAAYFKQKYQIASYGYAINAYMLSDMAQCMAAGVKTFSGITKPSQTIVWADAAQINAFQAPASPQHPMLEEWYFLDGLGSPSQKYHFRHGGRMNAVFADSSVKSLAPAPNSLDPRCDGLVGALEPSGSVAYLSTRK